jgi:hypothetical protein
MSQKPISTPPVEIAAENPLTSRPSVRAIVNEASAVTLQEISTGTPRWSLAARLSDDIQISIPAAEIFQWAKIICGRLANPDLMQMLSRRERNRFAGGSISARKLVLPPMFRSSRENVD